METQNHWTENPAVMKRGFVMSIANALRRYSSLSADVRLFIACQFALESDFGHSHITARCSNYCGMKVPSIRISTSTNKGLIDSYGGFANYNSLADCVVDYVLWLSYNRIPIDAQRDITSFKEFLVEKKYCPLSDYISRIEAIYNQYV